MLATWLSTCHPTYSAIYLATNSATYCVLAYLLTTLPIADLLVRLLASLLVSLLAPKHAYATCQSLHGLLHGLLHSMLHTCFIAYAN